MFITCIIIIVYTYVDSWEKAPTKTKNKYS